ncbi:hypothetical protein ACFX1T_043550 [Malus domestica]
MIDMTSSNEKKNKATRSEPVVHAMSKMASTIADKIAQRRGFVMPSVLKSVLRRLLGAKFGSPLEMLAIIKSDKVDSAAKLRQGPLPLPLRLICLMGRMRLFAWAPVRNPLSLLLGKLLRSVRF